MTPEKQPGNTGNRSMKQRLTSLIQEALQPQHLEVIDESHMHNVPKGAQSHFKIVVVSNQFEGLSLVNRHRMVNSLAKPLFDEGLHALALHTMTPEQWQQKGGTFPKSPPCMGGGK
ncbi:MAG: BolA family transcriptional regulator [Sedimenticola selenatireducens]|jgi:BolA protein|uniref:BolA family transcriptional regulator n=2 Tax=Sedimenticola selenatireducens TaxID=191960 RepID=A0A557SLY8_9GAMM|nr:BolA family transcriptional regulator [Sedimenticola selenatireducens]TVT62772.1 MAG: BolA family transcriptional regulator [Sedimenticola selenatireducens]